jgi:hypothetical protein
MKSGRKSLCNVADPHIHPDARLFILTYASSKPLDAALFITFPAAPNFRRIDGVFCDGTFLCRKSA